MVLTQSRHGGLWLLMPELESELGICQSDTPTPTLTPTHSWKAHRPCILRLPAAPSPASRSSHLQSSVAFPGERHPDTRVLPLLAVVQSQAHSVEGGPALARPPPSPQGTQILAGVWGVRPGLASPGLCVPMV